LLDLLASLSPAEWNLQTVSPAWKVRDVAAHLLDTALRKLSMARDCCFVETAAVHSADDVILLVNRLNREGVAVYRRLSPPILIQLMKSACEQSADFHESLDPFASALFAVSWAGEAASFNWFDTARELTERWHHQQQIRLATGKPGIMTPELYRPVLDCFLRGLPHAYRNVEAASGTLLLVEVSGECGGKWFLLRAANGWSLVRDGIGRYTRRVVIPQEIAWRLFTRGIDREAARAQIAMEGDCALLEPVLHLTSIVA
jgi:uncharacterized protein (TIGR03083 family)